MFSVSQCQQRCSDDSSCDCVTFRPRDGKCWKRKACDPSGWSSSHNGGYDVYIKAPTAPTTAPRAPSEPSAPIVPIVPTTTLCAQTCECWHQKAYEHTCGARIAWARAHQGGTGNWEAAAMQIYNEYPDFCKCESPATPSPSVPTQAPMPCARTCDCWHQKAHHFTCGARIEWIQKHTSGKENWGVAALQVYNEFPSICKCEATPPPTTASPTTPRPTTAWPTTPRPTMPPPTENCEESTWPDKDHNLVCGECTVLVDRFQGYYKSCNNYCEHVGRKCVGAWEELDDTCTVKYNMACDYELASSDAICRCFNKETPPLTPPSPPTQAPIDALCARACGCWHLKVHQHTCGARIEWVQKHASGKDNWALAALQIYNEFPSICKCEATPSPTTASPSTPRPTPRPTQQLTTASPTTPQPTTAVPPTPHPPTTASPAMPPSMTVSPPEACDESKWPDNDHNLVCGECTILVDRFQSHYKTCSNYCERIGRSCAGAWEELDDTCTVKYNMTCDYELASSDAICHCGSEATSPPATPSPTSPTEAPILCAQACDCWHQNAFEYTCGVRIEWIQKHISGKEDWALAALQVYSEFPSICKCETHNSPPTTDCPNSNGIVGYHYSHNGWWAGYVARGTTGSAQECANQCSLFAGCVMFNWVQKNGRCNAYDSVSGDKLFHDESDPHPAYEKCSVTTTLRPMMPSPSTPRPTMATPLETCEESTWPDKDHDLVCGECKVLVNRFKSHYKTCSGYCERVGRSCVGAWEELNDTCTVKHSMTCDTDLASSDAICQCGSELTPLPTQATPPSTTVFARTPVTSPPTTTSSLSQGCVTTGAAGIDAGNPCLFPFEYQGSAYEGCTTLPHTSLWWCFTQVDASGVGVAGQWGSCASSCPKVCDESTWPDKDHNLVCGECKVLVDRFEKEYKTCSGYCDRVGRSCAGAWEELDDTCAVKHNMTCDTQLATSDAICQCSIEATSSLPQLASDNKL